MKAFISLEISLFAFLRSVSFFILLDYFPSFSFSVDFPHRNIPPHFFTTSLGPIATIMI